MSKQRTLGTIKAISLAVLLSLGTSALHAQESEVTTLDTTVVSAAGYAQDTREAPASVSVVTQEQVMTAPMTDVGMALEGVPGVDVEQTKMGNTTISIRGFDYKYTLMLIDGRKQNTSDGMISNGFDPTSSIMPPPGLIDHIEVIRGPASTLYGSDAVGGVVNVITKKHPTQFTGSVGVSTTLQEHSKFANQSSASGYIAVPLKKDTLSLQLRGRYDYREATNIRTPSGAYGSHSPSDGYTANMGARIDLTLSPTQSLYLDADYTQFKGGAMSTSSKSIISKQWFDKVNVALGHHGDLAIGSLDTYLQYNSLSKVRAWSFDPKAQTATNTDASLSDPLTNSTNITLNTKLITPLDFGDKGAMTLSTGGEITYETFKDNQASNKTALYGKTLDQTLLSAFAEGEYFINDQWTGTLGARLNWSDIFGANLAPRAYLVYKPTSYLSFKGGVAAGYKTPAIKQLTDGIYATDNAGIDTYGNPDLKPEESVSYELSTTVDVGRYAQVTLGGFWTDFRNQLDTEDYNCQTSSSGETCDLRAINHGKVRTRGLELLATTQSFYGFKFTGGYTYTHAEILTGADAGERPNELPRHVITARLDYRYNDFSAYLTSESKFDMKRLSNKGRPNIDKYNNFTEVDLGASYVYAKHHRFTLAINNLLDHNYLDWQPTSNGGWGNAEYFFRDGRNYWLSYNYTW